MSAAEVDLAGPSPEGRADVPLAELEAVIERGLSSFVEVGNALLAIKINKRYRGAGYSTFEDYCTRRWGLSVRRGHQLVVAAATVESLAREITATTSAAGVETCTAVHILPNAERQVRPMVNLPPSVQREAWERAVASTGGAQPTADTVQAVVTEVLHDRRTSSSSSTSPPPAKRRQRPITDRARDAAWDLSRSVARLTRITAEERFLHNRETIAASIAGMVMNSLNELLEVMDELGERGRLREEDWVRITRLECSRFGWDYDAIQKMTAEEFAEWSVRALRGDSLTTRNGDS